MGWIFLPTFASASIQITEIMYDPPAADTGKEWIEITNTGAQAVDISAYKFAEANTNHKLIIAGGNSVLTPGASAIISSDPATFKANWPSYAGTIFKSTFSLSNTGETLAIKNASSSVEDTITYSSSVGATGDSGSLQRAGDSFIAGLPTPGIYPSEIKSVPKVEKPAPSVAPAKTKISKSSTPTRTASAALATQHTFIPTQQSAPGEVPLALWITGLLSLLGIGAAGAVYASLQSRKTAQVRSETKSRDEEFSLIES